MTMTEHGAIRLIGLRKRYGPVQAVDGVDLLVAPGEVVALLGPNGADKSTIVDMLLGLARPDEGEAGIFGRSPREAVAAGEVGAMLRDGTLLEDATVRETVGLVAALRRAGIAELAARRCGKLSGGQQQRVRFAVAMVSDPDLLVLDEPTVGMDVETRRSFWRSMREFSDAGRTVPFATHYLEEAEEFADRAVLMRSGWITADGQVAEVRATVSGRTLRAAVPGAQQAELAALPGVTVVGLEEAFLMLTADLEVLR